MGITNLTSISDIEYQTSKKTTKSLTDKIKNQKHVSSANLQKTAATNKKNLNLQPSFMTTFSETFQAKRLQHN